MKTKGLFLAAVCLSLLLGGCGGADDVDTTTVVIKKDGTIEENIITDFDKDYYSVGGLEQMLNEQIARYNQSAGEGTVKLDSVTEREDGSSVKTKIIYKGDEDYSQIHNQVFFNGTVSEAYDEGRIFAPVINQETGATLSEADILELGDKKIVISEEAVNISVSGKITHISEGITLLDKKTAVLPDDGEKLSYIIYE